MFWCCLFASLHYVFYRYVRRICICSVLFSKFDIIQMRCLFRTKKDPTVCIWWNLNQPVQVWFLKIWEMKWQASRKMIWYLINWVIDVVDFTHAWDIVRIMDIQVQWGLIIWLIKSDLRSQFDFYKLEILQLNLIHLLAFEAIVSLQWLVFDGRFSTKRPKLHRQQEIPTFSWTCLVRH